MKRLSPEQYGRARHFLMTKARLLDRTLFEYRFEGASADRVTRELTAYQNADGGFGHALEPDLRTPTSSALATGIGLSILVELERSAQHPMVSRAAGFLLQTFDRQEQVWRVVPRDANDHPHAPWWHDEDDSLAHTFDGFVVIPRAQVIGLLHDLAELVHDEWLNTVTEQTVSSIETLEKEAFSGGGDTLRYALELTETNALPKRFRDRLLTRLRDLTDDIVCREPAAWTGYCATPLKVAPSPDAAVADLLWDDLQRHLDYVIDQQGPQGTWEPTWTWGELYPQVWKDAKLEWRGHLTLETLTSLRAFGRIDA